MEKPRPYHRLYVSHRAYTAVARRAMDAGYVHHGAERYKGLASFITALFDSPTPLTSPSPIIPDQWHDTRPSHLLDEVDHIPLEERDEWRANLPANRPYLRYPKWAPWGDFTGEEDQKAQRLLKLSIPTLERMQLLALHFEIAGVHLRNHTFESLFQSAIANDQATQYSVLLAQASAVLEALGCGYLTPEFYPYNPTPLRRRYAPPSELAFF